MKLPHPWHHPDYARHSGQLTPLESKPVADGTFISGVTTSFETQLSDDHWHRWLVTPIDFIETMKTLKSRYGRGHLDFIEIGPHPVLAKCLAVFEDYTHVSSMFREESEAAWIVHQRKQLDPAPFLAQIEASLDSFRPGLDYSEWPTRGSIP